MTSRVAATAGLSAALVVLCAASRPAAQPSSGQLDIGGSKIYYEERGAGPAIVLIHDGILHGVTWDAQWEPFSKAHRVIRYDRRGYGRSEPPAQPFSEIDDLKAVMDHLKVDRATVVGSSAGGNLAIHFTLDHPQRVERLILVGPVISGLGFSDHFIERGKTAMAPLLTSGDVAATIENWVRDPYLTAAANAEAKDRLRRLLTAHPGNLKGSGRLSKPPDRAALPRLGEINVPTLIVVGDADIPDVHAHAGAIQAGIAGARRVIIPGAGHLVYFEKPEPFNQVVLGFLSGP